MPMFQVFGQSGRDGANPAAHSGRLVNCYREGIDEGGKARAVIQPVPGEQAYTSITAVIRAMETIDDVIYAVSNGNLYRIASGVGTVLGAVVDSAETSISGHDGYVTVVAGGRYWVWDGASLTEPAAGAFTSFGSVAHVGHYTILTEKGGSRFQWSEIANPLVLPGLNFDDTDDRDDNLVRVFVSEGTIWLFGTASTEIWAPDGVSFSRYRGATKDVGLKAFGLITEFDGGVFFIGDDDTPYVAQGTSITPVRFGPVQTAIRDCDPRQCLYYDDRGHQFCAIIFDDCTAWVFDLTTQEWHERAEGRLLGPWTAVASAKQGNDWYLGKAGGQIVTLGGHQDSGNVLAREAVSRTVYFDGNRQRLDELEFFAPVGQDGTLMFWLSKDNGRTWGPERSISFGGTGVYTKRMLKRALGQYRQLTVKVRVTDNAYLPFYSDIRAQIS